MRLIKTGKSIMNLTKEEANKLMETIYSYTDIEKIPVAKQINLFDDFECSMFVRYKSSYFTEQKYIFREDDIKAIKGAGEIPALIKIEFLINTGYLKIVE